MLLKDYIEYLTDLLDNNPECGELEVWTYSDDEGNSILPMYEGIDSAFVDKVYIERLMSTLWQMN